MEEIKSNNRLNCNRTILEELTILIEENPNLRFCQALQVIGINRKEELMGLVDNFHEESNETLKRIIENGKS